MAPQGGEQRRLGVARAEHYLSTVTGITKQDLKAVRQDRALGSLGISKRMQAPGAWSETSVFVMYECHAYLSA